ncbi:MAG: PAS domain-containing protein, partial [Pseudomonadota bacterium]
MDERVVDVSANAPSVPALDDLKDVKEPSWLWDAGRQRVVWSNDAGLDFFHAESLFDLIDRRFSRTEPGVARIMELAGQLEPKGSVPDYLVFPSAGSDAGLSCTCYERQLPDGRPGVLVVGTSSEAPAETQTPADLILSTLPLAIITFNPSGTVLSANPAAEDLFTFADQADLGAVLADRDLAQQVIQGTLTTGTFSKLSTVECRYGRRDLRLFAQAIGESAGRHIYLMLDDVTDRRALERHLHDRAESLSEFISSAADFTWQLDAHYVFVELSEGFEEATGVAADAVVNLLWGDVSDAHLVDPDPLIGYYLDQKRAWKAQIVWHTGRAADGARRLTLSAMPLFAPDGTFTG